MNRQELIEMANDLRGCAQAAMREDHRKRWPHVSASDFSAIVNAVGEISLDEAFTALERIEAECLAASPRRPGAET